MDLIIHIRFTQNSRGLFTIGLQVSTDAAQSALPEMVDTYRVVPVPAYEFDGGLMYLTHYKTMLVKALVELHFALTHYTIADKDSKKSGGNDVFYQGFEKAPACHCFSSQEESFY